MLTTGCGAGHGSPRPVLAHSRGPSSPRVPSLLVRPPRALRALRSSRFLLRLAPSGPPLRLVNPVSATLPTQTDKSSGARRLAFTVAAFPTGCRPGASGSEAGSRLPQCPACCLRDCCRSAMSRAPATFRVGSGGSLDGFFWAFFAPVRGCQCRASEAFRPPACLRLAVRRGSLPTPG
jgi:hypothetical protein